MHRHNTLNDPSVVLAHSGIQYVYPIARALQRRGLLKLFWTTLYGVRNHFRFLLPRDYLRRYHCEGVDPELIRSFPWPELFHKAWMLALGKNYFTRNQLLAWRARWFDRHVARKLSEVDFDYFIGFSGSCLASIKKAKSLGKRAIVNQHDVHHRFASKLIREEIELRPDFSPMFTFWPPHQRYLEQVDEELREADYILVPSNFALETHRFAGVPDEKLISIPLGIDLPEPTAVKKRKERRPFRILFVGTIGPRKGIQYLLEAMRELCLPQSELILLGTIDGDPAPLRPYAEVFRHEGFVSQDVLRAYWQSAHVLVLPSIYDALGLVIPEALSHGVPVIVTEHTVGREMVRDGIDGFVIPIRDVQVLKDRILRLYQDWDLWSHMSQNARSRAERFTWHEYEWRLAEFLKIDSEQRSNYNRFLEEKDLKSPETANELTT